LHLDAAALGVEAEHPIQSRDVQRHRALACRAQRAAQLVGRAHEDRRWVAGAVESKGGSHVILRPVMRRILRRQSRNTIPM
jgi:hypothetical protein